jgi:hypothetical protein
MPDTLTRPEHGALGPYFQRYIDLVPAGTEVLSDLDQLSLERRVLLSRVSAEDGRQAYAPGKWSVAEVVSHVVDCERVMTYRALSMARADPAELPGFEQDDWVVAAKGDERDLAARLDEADVVRGATVALFRSFDEASCERVGVAAGTSMQVGGIAWMLAGHERHHLTVLREKYGLD